MEHNDPPPPYQLAEEPPISGKSAGIPLSPLSLRRRRSSSPVVDESPRTEPPPTTAPSAASVASSDSSGYSPNHPMMAEGTEARHGRHNHNSSGRRSTVDPAYSQGCCFSETGGCCFSKTNGCCFSSNGGCCFSDTEGCCFSSNGGCCCSQGR